MEYVGKIQILLPGHEERYNGLDFKIIIKRDTGFYMTFYIIPVILFTIVAYCSFWVNPAAAPARTTLAIVSLLLTIRFRNGILAILPQVKSSIWL